MDMKPTVLVPASPRFKVSPSLWKRWALGLIASSSVSGGQTFVRFPLHLPTHATHATRDSTDASSSSVRLASSVRVSAAAPPRLRRLAERQRPTRGTRSPAATTTSFSKGTTTILAAYVDAIERMIMDTGLHHPANALPMGVGVGMGVVDVHGNSGDIDSLLSSDPNDHVGGGMGSGNGNPGDGKLRRLLEPYERHRAHDLRAECYRRGIRPIKKGPNANDNKNGYIVLLRKYDGTVANGLSPEERASLSQQGEDDDVEDGDSDSTGHMGSLTKKRKLPSPPHSQPPPQQQQQHVHQPQQQQQHLQPAGSGGNSLVNAAAVAANDLAGFYDATQATSLVPVLPMQYTNLVKPPTAAPATGTAATTTDLEILSGIANSYTTQTGANATHGSASGNVNAISGADGGMFCGNCRSVVTDQLMESIRLGRNKMQMLECQRLTDQRDRDTIHLKEIVTVLRDLRQTLRDAQHENRLSHELLVELEDDIAFFQTLKERTKDRMRKEMQEAREKPMNAGNVGTT